MKYVPIPSRWKQYNVKAYLSTPIQLQYIHILFIIVTLITFVLFMVYFTSLAYDEVVEIGAIKYSTFDNQYTCTSIGSRSTDNFNFASHSEPMDVNHRNYTFINYNPVDHVNDTYSYLTGFKFSSWECKYFDIWGNVFPDPLALSTNDGSMNYSIDKGNAANLSTCKSNLFQNLCNVTNYGDAAIKVYFWYDIITVINVSTFIDKLKLNYHTDVFSLYYCSDKTTSVHSIPYTPNLYITEIKENNFTFSFPAAYTLTAFRWYFSLTNGGSISSVWDLCKSRFLGLGNRSVCIYMDQYWEDPYYQNHTVFKIDALEKGMVECWYTDPLHGLIKTDYYDTYGQNAIVPTPSNNTAVLFEIEKKLFDYKDKLTTISNGDISYIRLDDKNVSTTENALGIWQNDICVLLINGYCNFIDVPPYFCKKNIHKTIMESISLSLSPTSTAYSILLLSWLFIVKCKLFTSNAVAFSNAKINIDDSETNLVKY